MVILIYCIMVMYCIMAMAILLRNVNYQSPFRFISWQQLASWEIVVFDKNMIELICKPDDHH